MIYLDTHVVAWLYSSGRDGLSPTASEVIEGAIDLRVSPMVRLELQYLHEVGRVTTPAGPVLDELRASLGLSVCPAAFVGVVQRAESLAWTRDPFDRLIVAHAALYEAPLITKDQTLHAHYDGAVW